MIAFNCNIIKGTIIKALTRTRLDSAFEQEKILFHKTKSFITATLVVVILFMSFFAYKCFTTDGGTDMNTGLSLTQILSDRIDDIRMMFYGL